MSSTYMNPTNWPDIWKARASGPPSSDDAVIDWIHGQHIPTSYEVRIRHALDRVLRSHRATTARSLAISAPEGTGKTASVMSVVLADAFAGKPEWLQVDPTTGRRQIPWVYVNAMTASSSVSILRQVTEFCGFVDGKNEDELRKMLASLLPLHGVRGIVVDEAQTLRRSTAASSKITDGLRGLQHLPVPFVFVGIDLASSALLRDFGKPNDSVRQISLRTDRCSLPSLSGPRGAKEIHGLITEFGRRLKTVPGFNVDGLLAPGLTKRLAFGSNARPGLLFETLKNASAAAVENERHLTEDLLFDYLPNATAEA